MNFDHRGNTIKLRNWTIAFFTIKPFTLTSWSPFIFSIRIPRYRSKLGTAARTIRTATKYEFLADAASLLAYHILRRMKGFLRFKFCAHALTYQFWSTLDFDNWYKVTKHFWYSQLNLILILFRVSFPSDGRATYV